MANERLSHLTLMSIEYDILTKLIKDFAKAKSRKVSLPGL